MNTNRPMNLELTSLKFPAMAIASILHRLSGLALFILLPYVLYWLQFSLSSKENYAIAANLKDAWFHKALFFIFLASLIYHLLAGIRHILMDMGLGEHLATARRSAIAVIAIAFILTAFVGLWLC